MDCRLCRVNDEVAWKTEGIDLRYVFVVMQQGPGPELRDRFMSSSYPRNMGTGRTSEQCDAAFLQEHVREGQGVVPDGEEISERA